MKNEIKFFIYDTFGYIKEGWIESSNIDTIEKRILLLGEYDILRLIYVDDIEKEYAIDYDHYGVQIY